MSGRAAYEEYSSQTASIGAYNIDGPTLYTAHTYYHRSMVLLTKN